MGNTARAKKASDEDIQVAVTAREGGESERSIARRLGISHVTLRRRMAGLAKQNLRQSAWKGFGEFDGVDVHLILAVARAGIPGGLTEQARYMECSLLDLLEVCRAFGVPCEDDDPGEGDPDQDEDEDDLG
jgi:hypothetical protein